MALDFGVQIPIVGEILDSMRWIRNSKALDSTIKNSRSRIPVDCKTVGFFLKISKEIGKAWHKSLTRAKRASFTRP